MMVMRRREGETILIGDSIEIHITRIGRSRVKIAIDAPKEIPVIAKEVKVTRDENLAAAQSAGLSFAQRQGDRKPNQTGPLRSLRLGASRAFAAKIGP